MPLQNILFAALLLTPYAVAQTGACDLRDYTAKEGLAAEKTPEGVQLTWTGERQQQLRASFAVHHGQPTITRLSARKAGAAWIQLGGGLTPEYEVTTGKRRMSEQQLQPLRNLKMPITEELLNHEKWNAFWDAPLEIPGRPGTNLDLPRKPEEIRRAHASYQATGCTVKTDGSRLQVTFPGVQLGIFAGELRYTVYRGANLLRQEVIAKTDEPSVAYKYDAGLKGFQIASEYTDRMAGRGPQLAAVCVRRRYQQGFGAPGSAKPPGHH